MVFMFSLQIVTSIEIEELRSSCSDNTEVLDLIASSANNSTQFLGSLITTSVSGSTDFLSGLISENQGSLHNQIISPGSTVKAELSADNSAQTGVLTTYIDVEIVTEMTARLNSMFFLNQNTFTARLYGSGNPTASTCTNASNAVTSTLSTQASSNQAATILAISSLRTDVLGNITSKVANGTDVVLAGVASSSASCTAACVSDSLAQTNNLTSVIQTNRLATEASLLALGTSIDDALSIGLSSETSVILETLLSLNNMSISACNSAVATETSVLVSALDAHQTTTSDLFFTLTGTVEGAASFVNAHTSMTADNVAMFMSVCNNCTAPSYGMNNPAYGMGRDAEITSQ
jgi:hypothetical protein